MSRLVMLASFSQKSSESRGRLHYDEKSDSIRDEFQRDRDRIINSNAFRRLQYKTQVFMNHQGDYYRTRLTHTLEVAQIARTLAIALGLHPDLAETCALAHDLGHPPFGHAGEHRLQDLMQYYGGFDHNAHTLKLLTHLEQRYATFDGLNLTWESLEGIVKHNGPFDDDEEIHWYIKAYNQHHNLDLYHCPSLEAQVAAIADDIAYNNHDIQDGLRAGLFTVTELLELEHIALHFEAMLAKYPEAEESRIVFETLRHLSSEMVNDVIRRTKQNIESMNISSDADIRSAKHLIVEFSPEYQQIIKLHREFLSKRMYQHPSVRRMTVKIDRIINSLFEFYSENLTCLPREWQHLTGNDIRQNTIVVCDFIAGMTDRYAIKEYKAIFDPHLD